MRPLNPTTSGSSQPASPLDEPALAEFSLELPPEAPASVEQMPEALCHSNTRATGELVTADLPLEGQNLVEAAGQ